MSRSPGYAWLCHRTFSRLILCGRTLKKFLSKGDTKKVSNYLKTISACRGVSYMIHYEEKEIIKLVCDTNM